MVKGLHPLQGEGRGGVINNSGGFLDFTVTIAINQLYNGDFPLSGPE